MRIPAVICVLLIAGGGVVTAQGPGDVDRNRRPNPERGSFRDEYRSLEPEAQREFVRRFHEYRVMPEPERMRRLNEDFRERRRAGQGAKPERLAVKKGKIAARIMRGVLEKDPAFRDQLPKLPREERIRLIRKRIQEELTRQITHRYLKPEDRAGLPKGNLTPEERKAAREKIRETVLTRRKEALTEAIDLMPPEVQDRLRGMRERDERRMLSELAVTDLLLPPNAPEEWRRREYLATWMPRERMPRNGDMPVPPGEGDRPGRGRPDGERRGPNDDMNPRRRGEPGDGQGRNPERRRDKDGPVPPQPPQGE